MRRLLCLQIFFLTGCSFFATPSDWKRCRFEVDSVHFEGFRENQTEWKIHLAVHNPNSHRLKMEGVQLVALMGSDTLAAMRSAEPLDLSPGDTTRIPVDIALSNAALRKAMSEVGTGMKSQVTVTGDAFYHTWLGTKKFTGAFNKTYEVDFDRILGSMGNRLFQGLFLAP